MNISLERPALIGGGHSLSVYVTCDGYSWCDIRAKTEISPEGCLDRIRERYEDELADYKKYSALFRAAIIWHRNKGRYSVTTCAEMRTKIYKHLVILKTAINRILAGTMKIELQKID